MNIICIVISPALFLDVVVRMECNFAWWLVLLHVLLHVFVTDTYWKLEIFRLVYRNCELCVIGMLFKKREDVVE
jgi:hypothetical protein